MMNSGVDITDKSKQKTPLFMALDTFKYKLMKFLLDETDIDINFKYCNDSTILINSVRDRDIKAVKILLEYKDLDLDIRNNDGKNALYYALKSNNKEIIRLLEEYIEISEMMKNE